MKLQDATLKALTPQTLQEDANINAIIAALDPELRAITRDIEQAQLISRIDRLNEQQLSLMAYQFHADFYDLAATLQMKREAIKRAILLHMKKGTVWAIKEALRELDIEAEFVAWWESGSQPYTFGLRAIVGGEFYRTTGKDALIRNIYRAVNEAKSARSVLTSLHTEIRDRQDLLLYAGAAALISGSLYLPLDAPPLPDTGHIYIGTAAAQDGEVTVGIDHTPADLSMEIYTGTITVSEIGIELGVDKATMHELLLQFERRIFSRLDKQEAHIHEELEAFSGDIMLRIESIENALCWSGNEDE